MTLQNKNSLLRSKIALKDSLGIANRTFEASRANRSNVMKIGVFLRIDSRDSVPANRPASRCESPGHLSSPTKHSEVQHRSVFAIPLHFDNALQYICLCLFEAIEVMERFRSSAAFDFECRCSRLPAALAAQDSVA